MKYYILSMMLLLLLSCNKTGRQDNAAKTTPKTETVSEKSTGAKGIQNNSRPDKSEIRDPKYGMDLVFGIWTTDPNGPHADFEITKKYFYIVDYDGNGEMPYILHKDTIKVFYPDFTSMGIITKATKDSLSVNWDTNGVSDYVKWTN